MPPCIIPQLLVSLRSAVAFIIAAGLLTASLFPASAAPTPSPPNPPTTASPAESPSPKNGTSPAPPSLRDLGEITPYPIAEIASQAEIAEAKRRKIEADLTSWEEAEAIERVLPSASIDIALHQDETTKAILSSPSFDTLPELEKYWKNTAETLADWSKQLTQRIHSLQGMQNILRHSLQTWEATRTLAQEENAPPDILSRIKAVTTAFESTFKSIERESTTLLKLQARVAELETKVGETLVTIRQELVKGLFARDKAPLWKGAALSDTSLRPLNELFATQWKSLKAYGAANSDLYLGYALAFGLILTLLRHWRRLAASSSHLIPLQKQFQAPLAAALLLTLALAQFTGPQPPRLLWIGWTSVALALAITILRPLLKPGYLLLFGAAFILFLCNEVRDFTISSPFLWRLLLLIESTAAFLFAAWALRRASRSEESDEQSTVRWHVSDAALRVGLATFAVASVANIFGYARSSAFLLNAYSELINSAIIAYTFVRLFDAYLLALLSSRLLSSIRAVANHRSLLWHRACLALRWLAITVVLLVALQRIGLRSITQESLLNILNRTIPFTAWSLADVLYFGLTIWAAFLLSRLVRFLLDEEVYPRLNLSRGLPYAISTVLHYAILLGGFLAAVGNLSRFTVLAGAFGVGLGFGLQNIVNNFVSGLILLFERPVKVGDVVQIDADTGVVQRIGIRASVIRTPSGSELILPNSKLISDKVTNWTFSSRQRGFEIPLSIPRTADPSSIIRLLEETARENPRVSNFPAPQALLIKLTATTLDFELRAWTNQYEDWVEIRSELTIAIEKAFTEGQILPQPAR